MGKQTRNSCRPGLNREIRSPEQQHPWAGWVRVVSPGQPLLQLPGTDPVQFSAQLNLSSISGSSSSLPPAPGEELWTAREIIQASPPGCLVWARNNLLSGLNRGSGCPPRIRGQVLATSVCQWPHLSPHAGPLTSYAVSSQQWGRPWGGGFIPQKPKLRPALWAKGEHVSSTANAEEQVMGTCQEEASAPLPLRVKLGRAVMASFDCRKLLLKIAVLQLPQSIFFMKYQVDSSKI